MDSNLRIKLRLEAHVLLFKLKMGAKCFKFLRCVLKSWTRSVITFLSVTSSVVEQVIHWLQINMEVFLQSSHVFSAL